MDFLPINTLGGLAAVIIGFSFIIFVHELGHFLVAKYFGIKCPQFAIGMGNAIVAYRPGLGWRRGTTEPEYMKMMEDWLAAQQPAPAEGEEKKTRHYSIADYDRAAVALGLSETEYRLNWLPLGGYVKMLGQEDNDPTARSEDPRSFTSKSVGARAAVLSAGVIMNVIFGVLFFMIAFLAGVDFNAPVVGAISPNTPAAQVYAVGHDGDPAYKGIRADDRIVSYDESPVADMTEVLIRDALSKAGTPIKAEVERTHPDGKVEKLTYLVTPRKSPSGLLQSGIPFPVTLSTNEDDDATRLQSHFLRAGVDPALAARIQPGVTIVEVGGQKVTRHAQFEAMIRAAKGQPMEVVFEHPKTKERTVIPLKAEAALTTTKVSEDETASHLAGFIPATTVSATTPDSPAQKAGLLAGDVIARIGEVNWPQPGDIAQTVGEAKGGAVKLVVLRNGAEQTFNVTPEKGMIGIAMGQRAPYVLKPLPGSPAEKLNLPAGTRITAIDDQKVASFADMQAQLSRLAAANPKGFEAAIDCEPYEGKTIEPLKVTLAVDETSAQSLAQARWDVPLDWGIFKVETVKLKGDNPLHAISLGIEKAHQSMLQVYVTLLRVSQGSVHPKNFQGPVGIAHTGTKIVQKGWTYLMFFLGLISVNLAVVNFLPIPVVDGGHILFLIIEKIKGSPVNARVQNAALFAGLALIACMFLYVTYNDIVRLIKDVVS